jgi:hypothetical protein
MILFRGEGPISGQEYLPADQEHLLWGRCPAPVTSL